MLIFAGDPTSSSHRQKATALGFIATAVGFIAVGFIATGGPTIGGCAAHIGMAFGPYVEPQAAHGGPGPKQGGAPGFMYGGAPGGTSRYGRTPG